ncbi:3-deoxy-D-manno-octulosonate 8-phosphate phosphatase (KDO 8-P phosphatase) [Chitinivorax tropicus]|uniref:3-deoxy-D-manno-octulosonate 8-phosphate phosphatase KdsC n=1 Tax=Chitinivorax tropicus TaxID=714531 RepID=A0A840MQU6_9PROT|nr:3-deoxy-manno-octulosonate-8-phosphatase KdsC [Chitinivorax tropicus]MBB5019467.1 3-deoxy-D-manno-octulosonate 8-phosphate phosphatase (KDO 8-P phosphatase) [Chitinivorax tropicus]
MQAVYDRASAVRLMIFDVDGVLTDGKLYLSDSGEEIKAFNTLDGHGMKMLRQSGVELAIITGRTSKLVALRARNLGITHLYQGVENKLDAFQDLLAQLNLRAEQAAYMGDDVIDLPVMRRCGLAFTVPAAPAVVKRHAHYVSELAGGSGAVREVCELLMQAQGTLDTQLAPYLA